jgi:hypothetical protein
MLTRIEKLADHLGGRSSTHQQDYIAEIKRYADLVLGDYDVPAEKARKSVGTKPAKVAA